MNYDWLKSETSPKMIVEAMKLYGIKEVVGRQHNPTILGWAEEIGLDGIYKEDEMPWCGLFMAVVAKRAGKKVPLIGWNILRALQWEHFGNPVTVPMFGDVLVFKRDGGGHVGLYVGEDEIAYHVLGGNQGNGVNVMRLSKSRLFKARRPDYKMTPMNVSIKRLSAQGKLSSNEA